MNAEITREEFNTIKNIPMLFILGKGRSGTSLLQNMLDAHPAIIGPQESKFAVLLYPLFSDIKKWKKSDILLFVKCLYMEPLFANLWHIDKDELTNKLLSVMDLADYSILCKIVYYQFRKDKENVLLISDKNPQYVLFIDTLLKIFPEARFVHIVREPRDNIYSHIVSFNDKNPIFRAYQWLEFNKIIERKKAILPGRFFSVKYENLVSNPEIVMRSLSEFLGIPFSDKMARNKDTAVINEQLAKSEMRREGTRIHKELLRPVNTSNIGKWKKGMSNYARQATEIITAEFAKNTYGYEVETEIEKSNVSISRFKLLKGKWLYLTWQAFTRIRFKNFRINLWYSKLKRFIKKDKLPLWEYF